MDSSLVWLVLRAGRNGWKSVQSYYKFMYIKKFRSVFIFFFHENVCAHNRFSATFASNKQMSCKKPSCPYIQTFSVFILHYTQPRWIQGMVHDSTFIIIRFSYTENNDNVIILCLVVVFVAFFVFFDVKIRLFGERGSFDQWKRLRWWVKEALLVGERASFVGQCSKNVRFCRYFSTTEFVKRCISMLYKTVYVV